MAFEAAKRIVSRNSPKRRKKEPITPDIINRIVNYFKDKNEFPALRFIIICLICYTGFLRISELLNLKVKNLDFLAGGLKLTIPFSKTDQLYEGDVVYISSLESEACPVKWLNIYLEKLRLKDPENFIICRLAKTKKGHSVFRQHSISYAAARNSFLKHLSQIVDDTSIFGLHPLRSGGGTAAANSGVTDRLIAKQGRWSSTSSRDGYIKDSTAKRFKVSASLGI